MSDRLNQEWHNDIARMHDKYGVKEWVKTADQEKLHKFLEFRINFLEEELTETLNAFLAGDAEEVVDGLIDLCVVAIGTLDAFGIDADKAWFEVLKANMAKEVGVKEGRPNPLGLPDLVKPEGWEAPSHEDNHGLLSQIFTK